MSCLTLLGILYALSFALSLALSFVIFLCSLEYNRSAHYSLYIIGFNKKLYVELIANQYRCFIRFV